MSKPFFSVVIPCYNSEAYIEQTLESIYRQSFVGFEIILIDDQSTDNSLRIANKYFLDNNLRGVCSVRDSEKYPKGVSGCRNQGVDMAQGEWICFLDSDDLFHPEKLKILYTEINKTSHAGIKAIYHTPLDFIDGESVNYATLELGEIASKFGDISKELLSKNLIYTSAVSLNKDVFLRFRFDYDLHGIEDYYLWLNISKISPWIHIDAPLTAYRVRQSSLMGGRKMEYYITQNSNLVEKIKKNPLFSKGEVDIVVNYLMVEIMNYYANISLRNFGWGDFTRGTFLLIRKGFVKSSLGLFFMHLKFKLLALASKIINRK